MYGRSECQRNDEKQTFIQSSSETGFLGLENSSNTNAAIKDPADVADRFYPSSKLLQLFVETSKKL